MSSAADSPVRIFLLLAEELGSQASEADFGRSMRDSFASFDPATSSWKTSQHCLLEGLSGYSETWPRSGMTLSGIACPLPTLAPLTDGTESGSLPTPTVADSRNSRNATAGRKPGSKAHSGVTLSDYVTLWPTPRATDYKGADPLDRRPVCDDDLPTRVKRWPTPRSSDADKGIRTAEGAARERARRKNGEDLPSAVGGSLNPMWVEWLMGFPAEWTVLSALEMPLSRRSQKSSGAQS